MFCLRRKSRHIFLERVAFFNHLFNFLPLRLVNRIGGADTDWHFDMLGLKHRIFQIRPAVGSGMIVFQHGKMHMRRCRAVILHKPDDLSRLPLPPRSQPDFIA